MMFRKVRQLGLASAVSAALVLGITACGQSNTIDFVYVASASSNPGNIYAFSSDGESGALRQIPGSPFPSGGRNPVAMVTSPDGKFVYVVNHDDNTVVEFKAGSDGKLFPQNTYPNQQSGTPGVDATNLAISPDGKALYVVYAYGLSANGTPFSATTPGVGALARYPVNADGSLGTPVAYPTCNNPVAVNVLGNNSTVYVVNDPSGQLTTLIDTVAASNRGATGSSTVTYPAAGACFGGPGARGQITTYNIGSDGTLTPGAGSPFSAGVAPVAIASDLSYRFVYVTDFQTNQMLSYQVETSGGLESLPSAPQTPTGQQPSAITIDPRGQYIYVSNYTGGSVSAYALNSMMGTPSAVAGPGSSQVNPGPAGIIVEPSIGRYIYTANFIDNSVSGLLLDPNTGATSQVQNSPFNGPSRATAVAAVRHGDHPIQVTAKYGGK